MENELTKEFLEELTTEFATKIAQLFVQPKERVCWLILQSRFQNILNEMDELLTPQKCLEVLKLYVEMQQKIIEKGYGNVTKTVN